MYLLRASCGLSQRGPALLCGSRYRVRSSGYQARRAWPRDHSAEHPKRISELMELTKSRKGAVALGVDVLTQSQTWTLFSRWTAVQLTDAATCVRTRSNKQSFVQHQPATSEAHTPVPPVPFPAPGRTTGGKTRGRPLSSDTLVSQVTATLPSKKLGTAPLACKALHTSGFADWASHYCVLHTQRDHQFLPQTACFSRISETNKPTRLSAQHV